MELYTIGHSTHPPERFLELLAAWEIALLADIRRFPGSRKFPHFNRENLETLLTNAGIGYRWFEDLGGRRKGSGTGESPNSGLRNESFRNYADYMATETFHHAMEELRQVAQVKRTAYMCSESVFWRCHRRLVSDYLLARGDTIWHIMPNGDCQPHSLTTGAIITDGNVIYPGPADLRRTLFD